ncbi:dipeptidyl peptidase IV N-terminal region-domain-containing protein [Syncephalis fuscata]|nr:dipeptidyl peptidase IV N-terminal region-domain-containing protein [Syncephalis fuscata]
MMEESPPGHVILTVPEVEALDRANTPSHAPLLGGNATATGHQIVNAAESDLSDDDDNDDGVATVYDTTSIHHKFAPDGYYASGKGYNGKMLSRQPPSWAWCTIGVSLIVSLVLFISGAIMFSRVSVPTNTVQSAESMIKDVVPPITAPNNSTIPVQPSSKTPVKPIDNKDNDKLGDVLDGRRYRLDDYLSGQLSPSFKSLTWLETPQDGIIVMREKGQIIVEMLHDQTRRALANDTNLVDPDGLTMAYSPFTVSADLEYIMFKTNTRQEWRHSSFSEYIIYEVATRKITRLTDTGTKSTTSYAKWSPVGHSVMFVRENDIYVKEVFTSNFVCWWSPNAQHIAYLRLDETNVPEFNMTMYVEKQPREDSYPTEVKIRYPKPGYPNPIASLHVFSLDAAAPTKHNPVTALELKSKNAFTDEDRLLVEVAWMGNTNLMIRAMNRAQDVAQLYLVDALKLSATYVREERGDVDGGWLDIKQALHYIPADDGSSEGYIDSVVHEGNDHLAYFSSLTADKPAYWLTHGDWEVVNGAASVDLINRRVFYISTERGSTERHLYSVALSGENKQALTPEDGGFYTVDFSPHAGWYTLSYKGPKLPSQKLYSTHESNLNVKEYLPPDFDPSKKYDGRGTGFKGRKFRVGIRKQLGTLETIDQVNAGRAWSKLSYVDPNRMAIWGWSYGGYMAAKVIEADSRIFQAGVSVAPVTNWRYYDSVYTERYMLTPQDNPDGYEDTAVRSPDGFRHARYLVIHGTGDDNVHFQQTARLVNMLTEASIDPAQYEVQFYTDNNHSMGQHGAYFVIWRRILNFLKRSLPLKLDQ